MKKTLVTKLTSIDIYFDFWCGDSKKNVPPCIRILDGVGRIIENPKKTLEEDFLEIVF